MISQDNPYRVPLGSNSKHDNANWDKQRDQWELNKAAGHRVELGGRVMSVGLGWWWIDDNGSPVKIPHGTLGTLMKGETGGGRWMVKVEWDGYPHPDSDRPNGRFCGLSQKPGDILPGFCTKAPEENDEEA